MKKFFLALSFPMILSACVTAPTASVGVVTCPENDRKKDVKVSYRSSNDTFMVEMKTKSSAHPKQPFLIDLRPRSGSRDVLVTIKGVSGELPEQGGSTSVDWMNVSGSYNSTSADGNKIVLCVPDVPAGTWYKFDVIVDGIGTIDPRLDVTH